MKFFMLRALVVVAAAVSCDAVTLKQAGGKAALVISASGQSLRQSSAEEVRGENVANVTGRRRRTGCDITTAKNAKIEFILNKIDEDEYKKVAGADDTSESKECRLHMVRPLWMKTLRCNKAGACEACTGTDGCWGFRDNDKTLEVKQDVAWTSYRLVFHVACSSDAVTASIEPKRLKYGTLKLFWDGKELVGRTKTATQTNPFNSEPLFAESLTLTHDGGHEFIIEFSSEDENTGGNAILKHVNFFMDQRFAACEDFHACLRSFYHADNSEEAAALRSDNRLQQTCLAAEMPHTVSETCGVWRQCLDNPGDGNPDYRARIQTLLSAAHVGSALLSTSVRPSFAQRGRRLRVDDETPESGSTTLCLNPPDEDAESWSCDCYAEAETRCNAIQSTVTGTYNLERCMTANFCLFPNVCEAWKQQVCNTEDVKNHVVALKDLSLVQKSNALLSRRSHGTGQRAESMLDATNGQKVCM